MKRVAALLLACIFVLSSCTSRPENVSDETGDIEFSESNIQKPESGGEKQGTETATLALTEFKTNVPEYQDLNNPELLRYVEDNIYSELITRLDSADYFVQNVSAVYVSNEYLEELEYNSKSNVFFGYTLAQLDEQFQGTKYVFTLGEQGDTVVEPFEGYDDTYERVIKNVVVGSGVILVCATVSAVSGGLGAPAVSMIFAMSAKTGTVMALSSGGIGAVAAGVMTGVQTKDFDEAVKAAALAGSEGFKWGAISGTIGGGVQEAVALKGATLNGLTMNEAAIIQKESGYPLDVIREFRTMEQYNICKESQLSSEIIYINQAETTMLIRDIDLNFVDDLGRTNMERMRQGLAALDPTGNSYQLHHIGQRADSTLAILTEAEHMQGGNNLIWHELGKATEVHGVGNTWDTQRQAVWKALAEAWT